jgi:hypothetical protein
VTATETAIKAIPTRYAGCHFRSRLEARWAVFFDSLGIAWEYEPQGFELPSGAYLPDFWLPDTEVWIEVKGQAPSDHDRDRFLDLAEQASSAGHRCRMLGPIPRQAFRPRDRSPEYGSVPCVVASTNWVPLSPYSPSFTPGDDPTGIYVITGQEDVVTVDVRNLAGITRADWTLQPALWLTGFRAPEVDAAFTAARSARFEHGQSGPT